MLDATAAGTESQAWLESNSPTGAGFLVLDAPVMGYEQLATNPTRMVVQSATASSVFPVLAGHRHEV